MLSNEASARLEAQEAAENSQLDGAIKRQKFLREIQRANDLICQSDANKSLSLFFAFVVPVMAASVAFPVSTNCILALGAVSARANGTAAMLATVTLRRLGHPIWGWLSLALVCGACCYTRGVFEAVLIYQTFLCVYVFAYGILYFPIEIQINDAR
jgi:hypothetical protein